MHYLHNSTNFFEGFYIIPFTFYCFMSLKFNIYNAIHCTNYLLNYSYIFIIYYMEYKMIKKLPLINCKKILRILN